MLLLHLNHAGAHQGSRGGGHSGVPFKCFLPDQRGETGLGCQMAKCKKKANVRE